jgi:hypothetical protein
MRSVLEFDALMALGAAREGGADVLEVMVTSRGISTKLANSSVTVEEATIIWRDAWMQQALLTASSETDWSQLPTEKKFRVAQLLQLTERFLNKTTAESVELWNTSSVLFAEALVAGLGPGKCREVSIPYLGAQQLPGFFCAPLAAAPSAVTVIAINGFDGSMLNSYVEVAAPALRAGFSVLIADGPGQGSAARLSGLRFTPKWGGVIDAAVSFLASEFNRDPAQVVLWGRSFGGFLAPKAFATSSFALKALIADGAIWDMYQNVVCGLPQSLQAMLAGGDTAGFDKIMTRASTVSLGLLSMLRFGDVAFGPGTSPSAFFFAFQDFFFESLSLENRPVLVNDPKFDTLTNNQSSIFWSQASNNANPHSQIYQLPPSEGASLHCAVGSTAINAEAILTWLQKIES